ncbi:MAG: glycosyl transferase, partial [Tannerella sp.]|nr:glycosyl transferase [Tannerella sp.]
VGGLKESIERAGTGLVCLPTSESLAENIQKFFLLNKELFIENIQKEKQALSWDNFAKGLTGFIETI